jgi:LytS/YehU family sensor histidine kinase
MLELQSEVLRHVLLPDRPQEVPLADELRFIEQYLAIEQVRFSDRLRVEWSVDERARTALVPDFIMQPIVENAIRHGIAQRPDEGVVAISARVDEDSLELVVQDNGPGIPPVRQHGVGLSNTTERLAALFGDVGSVTVRAVPDEGTRVVLRFPYRSAG